MLPKISNKCPFQEKCEENACPRGIWSEAVGAIKQI